MKSTQRIVFLLLLIAILWPDYLEARPQKRKSKHRKHTVHHFKKKKKKRKHSKATACPSFHKSRSSSW